MRFIATKLEGAVIVEPERIEDERGFFARTFCRKEFEAHRLNPDIVQCSISFNRRRGTIRGMHYQAAPNQEAKLVRCTRGALYDVIIDLRPDSATFKRWLAAELSEENCRMLYIPEGFAHGFQTLRADTEVFYPTSEFYSPEYEQAVRWNDPAFAIDWPAEVSAISEKDRKHQDFAA